MIIVAVVNYFDQGQVFFRQERIGRSNRPFWIIKFKTVKIKDGRQVVSPFAGFLRSHSLDEIPQLFNVLQGDMSLVGPRPLLPEYLDYYSPQEQKRHLVRPGITGLAQINGGNNLSWEEKFQLDVAYVDQMSLKKDIGIFLKSFSYIFKKSSHWDVMPLNVARSRQKH